MKKNNSLIYTFLIYILLSFFVGQGVNFARAGTKEITITPIQKEDTIIVGDWNGDKVDEFGVFRPSQNIFYLDESGDNTSDNFFSFGIDNDTPLTGDWDGDGKFDIGVYRPSNSTFYLNTLPSGNIISFAFGNIGDLPLTGDWDGDSKFDIGVYRPSNSTFYLDTNRDGKPELLKYFSIGTFTPDGPIQISSVSQGYKIDLVAVSKVAVKGSFKKVIFSFPVASRLNILELDGFVSLTTNSNNFTQSLIAIGYTRDYCPQDGSVFNSYKEMDQKYPNIGGLFHYILKNQEPGKINLDIKTQLYEKLPLDISPKGCLIVIIDGGEPTYGDNVTIESNLSLIFDTETPPLKPPIIDWLSYETNQDPFSINRHSSIFVKHINSYYYLRQIFNNVSATVVNSTYLNDSWTINLDYYLYNNCPSNLKEGLNESADYYTSIPSDAISLANITFNGYGKQAFNQPVFKTFSQPILVKPGSCLVSLSKFEGSSGQGNIESQIGILLQDYTSVPVPLPATSISISSAEESEENYHSSVTSITKNTTSTTIQLTVEDLQERANQLITQLQNLLLQLVQSGKTIPPGLEKYLIDTSHLQSTNPSDIKRDLYYGLRGEDVTLLQSFLIDQATGPKARVLKTYGPTGYFGSATRNALAEYQASVGIKPSSGYFGPITRSYLKSIGY